MKLDELKNKKILILGFGKEGRDTLKFLKKLFPKKKIDIADVKFSKDYLKAIKSHDVIIKAPGVPIHIPEVEKAYRKGKITSQTELFFDNCQGLIVGITGTKGKGTTASLIYKILKEGGFPIYLVGNIGKPVLNFLLSDKPKKIYVYELSSHQLFGLKKSPQTAVFLNIFPDHLDYFKDFKEYILAKSNIVRHQEKNDCLIYNYQDKIIRKIAEKSRAKRIPVKNYSKILKYLEIEKPPLSLLGNHNLLNIAAAVKVAQIFKIPKAKIAKAIKKFTSRTHRLEYAGKFRGIEFFNDSASTIPESTLAALEALGDRVETILLGGSEKGTDFNHLAKCILKSKIKNVILFPPTGPRIWKTILEHQGNLKKLNHFFVDNMADAVKLAYSRTSRRKICLLSPASASFGIFKDYRQRGDLFKKWVKLYGRAKT